MSAEDSKTSALWICGVVILVLAVAANDYREKRDRYGAGNARLRGELSVARADLDETKSSLDELRSAVSDLRSEVDSFSDGVSNWREVVSDVESATSDTETKVEDLESNMQWQATADVEAKDKTERVGRG